MYVAYLTDCDAGWNWNRTLSPVDKKEFFPLSSWIRDETRKALMAHRRVWIYWPYSHPDHGPKIEEELKKIDDMVVSEPLTNPAYREEASRSIRYSSKPIKRRLETVEGARCVVYYVEPSSMAERPRGERG